MPISVYSLVGKSFLYREEEWIVENIILFDKKCECRSYYSDNTHLFRCDFVKDKVESFQADLLEKEKNDNAIVIREKDEKELLKKIVKYYAETRTVDNLPPDILVSEMTTLLKIKNKIGLK